MVPMFMLSLLRLPLYQCSQLSICMIETKSNQICIAIKFLLSGCRSKSVSLSFNLTTNNQLSNGNPIKIKSF